MPRIPSALILAALIGAACAAPATAPFEGTEIEVGDDFFRSNHVAVFPDETIRWRWTGEREHNVTFDADSLGASPTQRSGTYTRTFAGARSGDTYTYYCTVHGAAAMSGIIAIR